MVLLDADNTSAEVWVKKACKRSLLGRALGRIQCALLINNPVGINAGRVSTKDNWVADRISHFESETQLLHGFDKLLQDFPPLKCCQRFHPSAELISLIMDALSNKNLVDPLEVSRRLLATPGRITT